MKTVFCAFILSLSFLLSVSSSAFPFEGPLQTRNQFPLYLSAGSPIFESSGTGTSLSLLVSHSSIFINNQTGPWSALIDMELSEFLIRAKKDFPGLFEIGIDVPVLIYSSGFMDGFLNAFHRMFGFSNYGRESRPDNAFHYEIKRNGNTVIRGSGGEVGLGDIRLTLKRQLVSGDSGLAVKIDVDLPTGNAKKGFGNGSYDAGVFLAGDILLAETLKAYCTLGYVFPGPVRGYETVYLKNYPFAGIGIEYEVSRSFRLLGQAEFMQSALPKTGIGSLDRPAALVTIGGRYRTGKTDIELSVTEDPNTAGAPDVTFTLGFRMAF